MVDYWVHVVAVVVVLAFFVIDVFVPFVFPFALLVAVMFVLLPFFPPPLLPHCLHCLIRFYYIIIIISIKLFFFITYTSFPYFILANKPFLLLGLFLLFFSQHGNQSTTNTSTISCHLQLDSVAKFWTKPIM